MIVTKTVKLSPRGGTYKRYREMGYDFRLGEFVDIKVADLPQYSPVELDFSCDYCGKIFRAKYSAYMKSMRGKIHKYACVECRWKEARESNRIVYGVDNVMQVDKYKEKLEKTNVSRYGVKSTLLVDDIQDKIKATCRERYGVDYAVASKEMIAKRRIALQEKYGVDVPTKSEVIKERIRKTCIERYGVDNPQKNSEVRGKTVKTLFANNVVYTSIQQKYLHRVYGGTMNFPISRYNVDILTPDLFVIEYDGGGHNLGVKAFQMPSEMFEKREIVRDQTIKRAGYKIIRITSRKDYLPSDKILNQMITDARNYFFDYPHHSWMQYDIDKGIMRNAEHKDGVPYLFGELRRIKKSDIA